MSWDDLTEEQLENFRRGGIYLCGEGAGIPGVADQLASLLGIAVIRKPSAVSAAVAGAKVFLTHLDRWAESAS